MTRPAAPSIAFTAAMAPLLGGVLAAGPLLAGCAPAPGARAVGAPTLGLEARARGEEPASLVVRVATAPRPAGPGARRLAALPAAWDLAVVRLSHPVALPAGRARTMVRDVDLLDAGAGAYAGQSGLGTGLRPAAGYTLDVELWQGAAEAGALVAAKAVPLALAGGANAVTVTLDVLADPLALTGMPAAASWGQAVTLAGTGLGAASAATLGGAAAGIAASAPTALDVVVPAIAPGAYPWRVTVGGRTVARAGFVVEAPPTGLAARASLAASRQRDPAVAATAAGFLTVWVDDRLAVKEDLIARPVAGDGSLPGGDAVVTAAASTVQARPHLAFDAGRGRALVAWQDGAGAADVLGRFVDALGAPVGASFALAALAGAQGRPRVAFDPVADAFLVAYRDATDVHAVRVAGDGTVGAPAVVAAGPGATALLDVAAAPAAGRHLVVWNAAGGVRGQLLDAAGRPAGGPLAISVGAAAAQVHPAVAADGGGGFLVAWVDQATPPVVRVRRVAAADGALGAIGAVAADAGAKGYPRLAWAPWQGRYLVVWQGAGDGTDVLGAYVGADGTPWGAAFVVAGGPGDQVYPEVAAQPAAGRSLVAFEQQAGGSRLVNIRQVR